MLVRDFSMDKLVDRKNGTISPVIFSHPDIYEQELELIFARMWLFVGHESQTPNPGDFVRSRMGEEQVIVTRGRDKQIHVLLNSCAHRGNMVCRYDQGNALGFQCSFHGWTYDNTGALINLAPGSEEAYAPDLRKEDWGLLKARVELFQGTIWATWDDSAPSLVDYFGGSETYMVPPLLDAEGSDGGTEVLGTVMRWRVGMNWKLSMPDNDTTHFRVTHRSALAVRKQFGDGTRDPSSSRQNYHVWFPEGHTTTMSWQENSDQVLLGNDDPVIYEYMRERYELRKKRLGKLAYRLELPHIFPNMGAVGRCVRVLHPQGPTETEMWSWFLVDKDAPPEVKAAFARGEELARGPGGMIQKDDMENWAIQTRYSKFHMTRKRLVFNAQLGLSMPPLHGPSSFGLPGMWSPSPTDANIRSFYYRWAEVMAGKDWDDIRIKNPAR